MKEATGELNTTVFVILVVGVLMAFFYYTIWPIMKGNLNKSTECSKAICGNEKDENGYVTCHVKGSDQEIKCVYKG